MYNQTHEQETMEKALRKQGFRFANWIPAEPDADGKAMTQLGVMVMTRKPNRHTTEYREIAPDGTVTGP